MKRTMLTVQLAAAVVALLAVAGPVAAQSTDPRRMTFAPVEVHPPEPERVVLGNGMVVYLLEDHELPLVSVSATMRTGAWLDPSDKVGLAQLTGITMRTGGAGTLPAQALDEELEFLAANISVSFGVESGVATLDVLKKDLERGLELFADVLRRPRFEPRRIDLAKLQALEAIRRRHDQPQSIVSREFTKLLYGAEHPFARETSTQSIKAITRDDLVAFHRQFVQPHGMILGITGDFQRREILSLLGALFGDWTAGRAPELTLPAVSTAPGSLVRYIAKGTTQTHIRAGHLTMREDDPDYPAMVLLNDILGGGSFRSRLFQDIRTRRGLAYSIGSVVRAGTHARGIWAMRTETKTASTAEVISRLMANMERLREQPVSDQELAEAKDAFVNSFVFSFATPAAIVNRRVQLEYDGLPADFMQRLRDAVVALTAEDLLRVARTHLHPDQLTILTVGPAEAATSLAAFGEVKEIMLPPEG